MYIGDTCFTSLAGRGACEPAEEKCLALLDSLGIPYAGLTHDPGDTIEICEEIEKKLEVLRLAIEKGDDDLMREVMHRVVPTFKRPEEINAEAAKAEEMKEADEKGEPLPV